MFLHDVLDDADRGKCGQRCAVEEILILCEETSKGMGYYGQ
jgi:hypothetical protein